jgi:hypothetical protein
LKPEEIIAFNESLVFNVMNNQTGNGMVINKCQMSDAEKHMFEQQINLLKEENANFKKVIDGLMNR